MTAEHHRGRATLAERDYRCTRQKHQPKSVQTRGEARGNPEPQQRLRTTPRAENGKYLDIGRAHYAQYEEWRKANQTYGCTDQRLNYGNTEWIFIEGPTRECANQTNND